AHACQRRRRHLDQRRLLRVPQQGVRLHQGGRGAGGRAVRAHDRGGRAHRLSPRRLLPPHGHAARQADPRGHGAARRHALAAQARRDPARRGGRMKGLRLAEPGRHLAVLCLGAHSDDIEIGAGGTILQWLSIGAKLDVTWCVLSGAGPREAEARASAADFLAGAAAARIEVHQFRDGFFPAESAEIKAWFEALKRRIEPDVILTHRGDDAHQDHRETSRLTWNTFRDHSILEYEIPKWDGDVGRPNVYVPLDGPVMARKVELLM